MNWSFIPGALSSCVSYNESCFLDVQLVPLCIMDLPNGQTVVANKDDGARPTDHIILNKVLFVP